MLERGRCAQGGGSPTWWRSTDGGVSAGRMARPACGADDPGMRGAVLIVDDVLATGGTAQAAASLVKRCGGVIRGISCLIELEFLHGRSKLEDYEVHTFIQY